MTLQLATLHNHLDQIPTVATWFETAWPDRFDDRDTAAYLQSQANSDTLPMALVVFDGDELVGTVTLKRVENEERAPWLEDLFVPAEHRGRGLAELLVTAASRVAFGSGAEALYARTSDIGGLLEKLGWSAEEADDSDTVWRYERPPEPPSIYQRIGGEESVRALVDRFYDLMDELDEVETVRQMHARSLVASRRKLFAFLSGWMGGPNLYIEQYGHPRLRMRHMPFEIGTEARDQWLRCMDQALDEVVEEEGLREELRDSFAHIADHMRNRRGP